MTPINHNSSDNTNRPTFGSGPAERFEQNSSGTVAFDSLDQFSAWIDAQLVALEESQKSFETLGSIRGHFGR